MAFPTVAAVTVVFESANVTTHNVTAPASIATGDLLILVATCDQAPVISGMPENWVNLLDVANGTIVKTHVWYKIAAGGEGNFTYTTDTSQTSVNWCWRITGWHGTTPPEAASFTAGASGTPDPPDLTASWGSADNLWIAAYGQDNAGHPVTAYPANYADNQAGNGGAAAGQCSSARCTRNLAAATENDTGTFTTTASDQWVAVRIVVRPVVTVPPFEPPLLRLRPRIPIFQK